MEICIIIEDIRLSFVEKLELCIYVAKINNINIFNISIYVYLYKL